MKHWLLGILLLFCAQVLAQEPPVIEHQLGDDGLAYVPLQFPFPYYGQVFTDSWMSSNGVVMFMNPYGNTWCCQGNDLTQPGAYAPSYSIMPLWTDLVDTGPGRYLTQGNEQYQRYFWENIAEYYDPNSLNTFSLEILPDGSFSQHYTTVNINAHTVTIGNTGNLQNGEFEQLFYGGSLNNNSLTAFTDQANGTYSWFSTGTYGTDPCLSDPLSNVSCAGYEQAYLDQQCSFNPLYDSQCPGYEVAYFDQQCAINPLYDSGCLGYEQAYFDQQCSIDALYDNQCPGYEVAYFDQQCSIDALYDNQCPGYEVAYILQNTSLITASPASTIDEAPQTSAPVAEPEVYVEPVTEITIAEPAVVTETVALAETIAAVPEATTNETENELTGEPETKEKTLSPALLKLALSIANQAAGPSQADNRGNAVDTEAQQLSVLEASISGSDTDSASGGTSSDQFAINDTESETDTSGSEITDIMSVIEAESIAANNQPAVNIFEQAQAEYAANATDSEQRLDQDTEMFINNILSNQFVTDINAANSVATAQAAFANNNMQQILAMGGNITQILNTPVPDFSRFDIKPPTQEEQTQTAKVENTLESMSDSEIEAQAQQRTGSMDAVTQAIALQLMGYKAGFDQYGGTLRDQSNWYQSVSVYSNNRLPSGSNQLFGAQDQKHQELMSLQYRR